MSVGCRCVDSAIPHVYSPILRYQFKDTIAIDVLYNKTPITLCIYVVLSLTEFIIKLDERPKFGSLPLDKVNLRECSKFVVPVSGEEDVRYVISIEVLNTQDACSTSPVQTVVSPFSEFLTKLQVVFVCQIAI